MNEETKRMMSTFRSPHEFHMRRRKVTGEIPTISFIATDAGPIIEGEALLPKGFGFEPHGYARRNDVNNATVFVVEFEPILRRDDE